MFIYVGIDIASEKHDCCIMTADRSILKQFSFKNDAEGFDHLLSSMSEYASAEETHIGLESTGVYGNNLVKFLRRKGYETSTFNPLLIKKSIQATTLRKTKTDKSDARFLALYLTLEPYKPDTQVSYHISELKSLSRSRFSLVQERAEAKTKLKTVLVQVFPEFSKVFSDVFGASAIAVLSKYPSAKAISKCRLKTLTEIIYNASRGRLGKDTAEQLIELAKHSIGTCSATSELDLSVYIDKISLLTKHIKVYEAKIHGLRMNGKQNISQESIIIRTATAFSGKTNFSGVSFQQIERYVANNSHVFSRMIFSYPTVIFTKSHIQAPM